MSRTTREWNGRIAFTEANSGGVGDQTPDTSAALYAARQRHNILTRRNDLRRAGLLTEGSEGLRGPILVPGGAKDIEEAAYELCAQVKAGRITRQHVESEQQADHDRLAGWLAVSPAEGTHGDQMVAAIRYRMAVRAKALEDVAKFELNTLLSTTARAGREVSDPILNRPWRPGAAPGSRTY